MCVFWYVSLAFARFIALPVRVRELQGSFCVLHGSPFRQRFSHIFARVLCLCIFLVLFQ